MLRFLLGIFVIQMTTVALVMLAPDDLQGWGWARLAVPLIFIALVAAFWFASISSHLRKDEVQKLRDKFAKERENIKLSAERSKTHAVKKAQKDVNKESRRVQTKAKMKIGSAFAFAAGAGALMLVTEFLMMGLILLTTAGGALGGYLLRSKQVYSENRDRLQAPTRTEKLIGSDSDKKT